MQSTSRKLRPYQVEAFNAVMDHWREWDREILCMATGTGKTRTAQAIAQDRLREGPVLFIAHREELLDQARRTFGWDTTGFIKAQECDIRPLTVGSIQTLVNRPSYGFKTIIVDEAHHAVSDSYRKVLAQYPEAKVLGLTATPDRKGLGDVFDGVAYEYGIRDAVRDGWLVRPAARTVPLDIDLSKVKVRVGDFEITGVAETLEPYLPAIADAIIEYAHDRKTVVFMPLVHISQEFRDILVSKGVDAREVNGMSEDRRETIDWFASAGKGSVLCNAMLLTEGWDCPDVDCVVMLRPTKSRTLYVQAVGRGLRLADGKSDCLLLDFLWLTTKHDLCRPASLVTANDEDVAHVAKAAEEDELDLFGAVTDAEESRREALAAALARQKRKKARVIDPLTWFVTVDGSMDLSDYEPEFAWQKEPMTAAQESAIVKAGLDVEVPTEDGFVRLNKGQASIVLDHVFQRRKQGLATAKQVMQLQKRGFRNVGQWTFEQASGMMGRLANNHWRVPWGVDPATYVPQGGFKESVVQSHKQDDDEPPLESYDGYVYEEDEWR